MPVDVVDTPKHIVCNTMGWLLLDYKQGKVRPQDLKTLGGVV